MGQRSASLAPEMPQSFSAHHPSVMLRRSAFTSCLATVATMLVFSTVLFSNPAPVFSQMTHLFVVCKQPDTLTCLAWPLDFVTITETKGLHEINTIQCGLSNLKPIPPHRRFITVKPFDKTLKSNIYCKTKELRVLGVPFGLQVSRVRRQTSQRNKGRYRGQTQSQYLSIDRGNGKDEGKAEAHSAADSSRAIVSGNSGMGQAQSQTIYDPSCDDCLVRSDIDTANLSYNSGQQPRSYGNSPGARLGPDQTTGGTYGPGQSPGGLYGSVRSPGGAHAPGQTTGTNAPGQTNSGSYGQAPGGLYGPGPASESSYRPSPTPGGVYGQDQIPGGAYGSGQTPGGKFDPGHSPGGMFTPGQSQPGLPALSGNQPGGTYTANIPGMTYGPRTAPVGSHIPGQMIEGSYAPGLLHGGHSPSESYRPGQAIDSLYSPGQSTSGTYGPDQSTGRQSPGTYGSGQTPGGSYISGQPSIGSSLQGQIPGGSYAPGGQLSGSSYSPGGNTGLGPGAPQDGQVPGGTYAPGPTPGGSSRPSPMPGGYYHTSQIPGGQSTDGLNKQGQSPGGYETYAPGQYINRPPTNTNQPGFYDPATIPGNRAGQRPDISTSETKGNQPNGPGYERFGGTSIQPGAQGINGAPGLSNGINWPLLSGLLPGAGSGASYFCCDVSPGNNGQSSVGPIPTNTHFGLPVSGGQNQFPSLNNNFGLGKYNSGTTGSSNDQSFQSAMGSTQPGNQANLISSGGPTSSEFIRQPQLHSNGPYSTTGQVNLSSGNEVPSNLQTPNIPYVPGSQNNMLTPNGPYSMGQNIPYGLRPGQNNLQLSGNNIPHKLSPGQNSFQSSTSGQNIPYGLSPGQNNLHSSGQTMPYGLNPEQNNLQSSTAGQNIPYGLSPGQNNLQSSTAESTGQNSLSTSGKSGLNPSPVLEGNYISGSTRPIVPYGTGNDGTNFLSSSGPYGNTRGQNSMLPSGPYGTATGSNSLLPYGSYGTTTGQNSRYEPGAAGLNTISGTPYGTDNSGTISPQPANAIGNGAPNLGMTGTGVLGPNNLQTPVNNGQNMGTSGPQYTGQYFPGTTGQNVLPNLGGSGGTGTNVPFGTGSVNPFPNGQTDFGQNNLLPTNNYGIGQTNYQPGVNNGIQGNSQQTIGQPYGSSGSPQNVIDPNSISSTFDDYDSEAQASVAQSVNGTTALAASNGGNKKGRAQTQVEGTYTGSGSFSANAEISDEIKAAQSHVSGSKKGASSSAEGRGRKNKSQASVKLGSETGSILTDSQSNGDLHSSTSQVQGSIKGGMADAQAKGPGSTSSQAQIGFTPYKEEDKKSHDGQKKPFEGGGSASAQTSGRMGTSQSQLRGTFKYGITYNGAAQAGSSLDNDTVFSNLSPFEKINVFDEKNKNINIDTVTTEKNPEITVSSTEKYDETTTTESSTNEEYVTEHRHSDHHKSFDQQNSTTRPQPEGNRRSFTPNFTTNGAEYDYTTDKDDNQPEDYDIDDGFGSDTPETGADPSEYTNYDEINRDTENTHQSLLSPGKKELEVKQTTGGNTQHIILGSLNNHDAKVIQKNSEHPDESKIYQPGERIPGMGGYTIPVGFTGSVKSVASKEKTYVVGSKYSPSQAQTVTLTPGTGKVKYVHPNHYGQKVNPKDLRSLYNSKADDNRYVSVSKSVTRDLDNENNIRKQYSHTYYTKSSSCGYFTFTCTMVSSAEGKKKVCKPKIPTNPDGSPMRC